jgi:SAM-dependent methyltransferase
MSADPRTIAAYEAHAERYADRFATSRPDAYIQAFIDLLPPGARVLDLGCGPGTASAFLRSAGMLPDPVDASPAMVRLANARHAVGARLASFDDIDAVAAYEGIWANFSLLHAPRADLPRHLLALHRALCPGGLFHIGMKTGKGEARDVLGRAYTYVTRASLEALLTGTGFTAFFLEEGREVGLAGTRDPFVVARAHG